MSSAVYEGQESIRAEIERSSTAVSGFNVQENKYTAEKEVRN